MKKISRISGTLLISMLLSSILSGVVLVIMETLNLPLDVQSIKVICGSIASVGYFYFFRFFTKEIEKIDINEISLNKKILGLGWHRIFARFIGQHNNIVRNYGYYT